MLGSQLNLSFNTLNKGQSSYINLVPSNEEPHISTFCSAYAHVQKEQFMKFLVASLQGVQDHWNVEHQDQTWRVDVPGDEYGKVFEWSVSAQLRNTATGQVLISLCPPSRPYILL